MRVGTIMEAMRFLQKIVTKITGGTILALASLFLGIQVSNADTNNFTINSSGTTTLQFSTSNPNIPQGPPINYYLYKGTYPSGTQVGGGSSSFSPQIPVEFLPNVYSTTTNTSTIGLEFFGNIHGDGDYWILQTYPGATSTWETFTRSGGTWIPESPVTGTSRIFNLTPTTNSLVGTSTTFTVDVENSTPGLNHTCITWQEISDFQSFAPTTHCENVFTNGIFTVSTSTTLNNGSAYIYSASIYTTASGTAPYRTTLPQNLSVGNYQWSTIADFYNTGTTTEQSMSDFCSDYTGLEGAICNFVVKFFAVPGKVLGAIYANIASTMMNVPPLSWYTQIKQEMELVQYQTATNQGIEIEAPFGVGVQFLTEPQLEEWTGGYLTTLRYLTTIALWIMFLIYILQRILYRIV